MRGISHEVEFAIFSNWMHDEVGQVVTTRADSNKLPHVLVSWTHVADACTTCTYEKPGSFQCLDNLFCNLQSVNNMIKFSEVCDKKNWACYPPIKRTRSIVVDTSAYGMEEQDSIPDRNAKFPWARHLLTMLTPTQLFSLLRPINEYQAV